MNIKKRNLVLKKIPEEMFKTSYPIEEPLKYDNDFYILNNTLFQQCQIAVNALLKVIKEEAEEILGAYFEQRENEIKNILIDHFYDTAKYYLMGRIFFSAKYNIDKDIDRFIEFDQSIGMFVYKNDGEKKLVYEIVTIMLTGPRIFDNLMKKQSEKLQAEILLLENRNGTYDKRIFKEAYKIQKQSKGKKPKITDELAIIKANEILSIYPTEQLVDENGFAKPFLKSIVKTYANHHRKKLKTKSP